MTAVNLPAQSWPPAEPPDASELRSALDEVASGRGGLVLLVGGAGIGKTRLADELSRIAAQRGFAVHWARLAPPDSETPFSAGPRPPDRPGPTLPRFELWREGEYWTVVSDEGVHRLKHTRGLETLHHLTSHPDVEVHATRLASLTDGCQDDGDAGELLDDRARAAYRARLEELREQLGEAESFGDEARASRAREEIEFLVAELSRAVGLAGRSRRAGVAAERARVTVQKRIRHSIRRIEAAAPALGQHLATTVQTGTFCCYRPRRQSLPER